MSPAGEHYHRDSRELGLDVVQCRTHPVSDLSKVRKRKRLEMGWRQFSGPGIKDLKQLCTGFYLRNQKVHHDVRDSFQQRFAFLWIFKQPRLGLAQRLAPS